MYVHVYYVYLYQYIYICINAYLHGDYIDDNCIALYLYVRAVCITSTRDGDQTICTKW